MIKKIKNKELNIELSDAFYYNSNKDVCIIIEMNYFSDTILCWDIFSQCGFNINAKDLIPIPVKEFMNIIDTSLEEDDVYTFTVKGDYESPDDDMDNELLCYLNKSHDVMFYEIGVCLFDDKFNLESDDINGVELKYFHQLQQINRLAGFNMPLRQDIDAKSLLLAKEFLKNKSNLN